MNSSVRSVAIASAVRGRPSSRATSPNTSPGPEEVERQPPARLGSGRDADPSPAHRIERVTLVALEEEGFLRVQVAGDAQRGDGLHGLRSEVGEEGIGLQKMSKVALVQPSKSASHRMSYAAGFGTRVR